jgi:hypothetical protein
MAEIVSIASSATYIAGNSSALASPSPTAADFHTPLQTPSGLAQHLKPESAKKKKKKKSEKKSATKEYEGGPFGEQMAQLDSRKFSASYYSNRDQHSLVDEGQADMEQEGKV